MPLGDLEAVIRGVLRAQQPFLPDRVVDRLATSLVGAIVVRDEQFRDTQQATTREQLLERLEVERRLTAPRRREVAALLPNEDTPEVVAERLKILAEMPADEEEETGDQPTA